MIQRGRRIQNRNDLFDRKSLLLDSKSPRSLWGNPPEKPTRKIDPFRRAGSDFDRKTGTAFPDSVQL
jgi:hypothetical protein